MIEVLAMNSAAPRKAGMSTKLRREERVLDPEKEQSIAILMRALNVTPDEVSDALLNGELPFASLLLEIGRQQISWKELCDLCMEFLVYVWV